jgi:LAS seventeen-binding protein 5
VHWVRSESACPCRPPDCRTNNPLSSRLPPPIRPTARHDEDDGASDRRGSLSDFSDYESSDEETHSRPSTSILHSYPQSRGYDAHSSTNNIDVQRDNRQALLDEEDPFADPFVDQEEDDGVGTPGIQQKEGMRW